jgi:hypothetical protein
MGLPFTTDAHAAVADGSITGTYAWTLPTLVLIRDHPGVVSTRLAATVDAGDRP